MTTIIQARQLAQQAGRGHKRSTESLLLDLVNDRIYTPDLSVAAGAGATGGTGGAYKSYVYRIGQIIKTLIYIDLTGLGSSTTDLDIIGVGASVAHLGRITEAVNGVIFAGRMNCLEIPATGADDIDLYGAVEATGVFDGGIAALDELALVTAGGAWTLVPKAFTALPRANDYLYLTGGEAGTVGTYTAGRFLIELDGFAIP